MSRAWRVISECALGQYSWVLSLMFLAGALNAWALAVAVRSHMPKTAGKIGVAWVSGVGSYAVTQPITVR